MQLYHIILETKRIIAHPTGIELNRSYLHAAQKNLERILREKGQVSLWEDETRLNTSIWNEVIS